MSHDESLATAKTIVSDELHAVCKTLPPSEPEGFARRQSHKPERERRCGVTCFKAMEQEYGLEKWVWTEADFDEMGWHDSQIHALAFLPEHFELAFDIDYIFQWLHPASNETQFKFWVAPATLIFENVYDVEFDIDSYNGGLEIDNIRREDARPPRNAEHAGRENEWLWVIECQEGEIKFRSVGYNQFIRSAPQLGQTQAIDLKTRAFSFARGRID